MKILEFYANFLPKIGGVQVHMRDLCKCAEERGHNVCVLTFLMPGPRFRMVDGVPVYNIRFPRFFYLLRFPFVVFYGALLALVAKMLEIDVIHAHDYLPGLTAALAGSLSGKPVFVTFHLPIQYTSGKPLPGTQRIEHFVKVWLLRFINRIICVSGYTLLEASKIGIPMRKMVVIHNWVPKEFSDLTKELGLFKNRSLKSSIDTETSVLSIGRLEKEKGFDILIRAVKVLDKRNIDVKLYIIGEGSQKEELVELAKDLSIKEKVFFLGKVSQREKLFSVLSADVFVVPSRTEGLPLTLLEAMSLGKAIVATKTGGTGEVIEDGYNGVLTDPTDSSIASSIELLVCDEKLRLGLGLNALITIKKSFTYEKNCTRVISVLESCERLQNPR